MDRENFNTLPIEIKDKLRWNFICSFYNINNGDKVFNLQDYNDFDEDLRSMLDIRDNYLINGIVHDIWCSALKEVYNKLFELVTKNDKKLERKWKLKRLESDSEWLFE
jgi:hypothetical protein